MRNLILIAAALVVVSVSTGAASSEQVTADDVLAMAAKLPAEGKALAAGFEKSADAKAIAAGIAVNASDRVDAARMLVYAAYESSLTIHVTGDGGASRGPFQLKNVPDEVAYDPARAAHYWLYLASKSRQLCASNPPDEQLASLASGNCQKARVKVRRREETARAIAGQ